MEDTGKLEERNKIVSELQTIIKERIELKEIDHGTLADGQTKEPEKSNLDILSSLFKE